MTDFLTRLIERTQGVAKVAQPIIQPMFSTVSNSSHDYLQGYSRDNELMNVPDKEIIPSAKIMQSSGKSFANVLGIPQENSSPTMPLKIPGKIPETGFAPSEHIESDDPEKVENVHQQVVSGQIDPEIIEYATNDVSPGDLRKYKPEMEKFSENFETSTDTMGSEHSQNGILQPENPSEAKREADIQPNMSRTELDQNIRQQPEHLIDEKQNIPGKLINSQKVRIFQEIPETELDQNIDQNPEYSNGKTREPALRGVTEAEGQEAEHLFNEKRNSLERSIGPAQESLSQEDTEIKSFQYIHQKPENLFKEERTISGRTTYSRKSGALQGKKESIEVRPHETSYLKPHISGKVGFKQMTEEESSPKESIIKVTIGRVEVRAVMPPAAAASAPRARTQSPILSLNDYLKQRNEGRR